MCAPFLSLPATHFPTAVRCLPRLELGVLHFATEAAISIKSSVVGVLTGWASPNIFIRFQRGLDPLFDAAQVEDVVTGLAAPDGHLQPDVITAHHALIPPPLQLLLHLNSAIFLLCLTSTICSGFVASKFLLSRSR